MRVGVWGTSVKKVADEAQLISIVQLASQQKTDIHFVIISAFTAHVKKVFRELGLSNTTFPLSHMGKVLRELLKLNVLIVIGGPFFEEPRQLASCFVLRILTKIFRVPMVTYGTTYFRLKTWWGKLCYPMLFRSLDALSARERDGIRILEDLHVKKETSLFVDPRFVLKPTTRDRVIAILQEEGLDPRIPLITITTRYMHAELPEWVKRAHDFTEETLERANKALSEVCLELANDYQLVLIPMHPRYEEDLKTGEPLKKKLEDQKRLCVLSTRYTATEIIGLIRFSQFLIAGRLGSTILATIAETPFLGIAYENRMVDYMGRAGMGAYCFDWRNLEAATILAAAGDIVARREWLSQKLATEVEANRKEAIQNSAFLERFISG